MVMRAVNVKIIRHSEITDKGISDLSKEYIFKIIIFSLIIPVEGKLTSICKLNLHSNTPHIQTSYDQCNGANNNRVVILDI